MRIIHAVRSEGFSGVERHITTLAAAQAAAGHEVTVVGGDPARMARALESTTIRSRAGRTVREVMASLRGTDGSVVHAHMTAGELAASLATAAPLVVTRHFARPRGSTPVGRLAGLVIRRRVQAQIAVSKYVAEAVDGPTTVVYPGVDSDIRRLGTPRRPVVLVVQRLQPEKNTHVAVKAFAAGAPDNWTLEIVGRGPQEESLRALTSQLGIDDRVSFLGFRDDVPALMRSSSVLLAPCEVEGLGLSVLEAMSHGLPVVASAAGAHPETVGLADDAQLFEPGDADHAGAMLARLGAQAALREAYGEQLARVQRTRFTPQAQAEATEAVYRQVLA